MGNYRELLKGVNILIQNEASVKKIRGYLQFEEASAEDTKRILEETGLSNGRDPSKLTYTTLLKWLSRRTEKRDRPIRAYPRERN